MVHGELGNASCEVATTSGICLSCLTALKYAYMNVALGESSNAVCVASELSSSFTNSRFFSSSKRNPEEPKPERPAFSFGTDFLRWMLSDGAGAVFLTSAKPDRGLAFRIDWIEHASFANELETCMYAGGTKLGDGSLAGWRSNGSLEQAVADGVFLIHQDVKLLNKEIMYTAGERMLPRVIERRGLEAEDVDWYLPHYSSDYFRVPLHDHMANAGLPIPFERWFTNLTTKGNTGAAASFIILEDFFRSDLIEKGQRVLCFIPESGRFSMAYVMLTVV
jgi:3-oxoacyl-[acyl-carrier-protein] synthase-3